MKRDYHFSSLAKTKMPDSLKIISKILVFFFFVFLFILVFTPWQQTSFGSGKVLALDPNDRVQTINSPITGRIKDWKVREGQFVQKGEIIVELEDIDPDFVDRVKAQKDAISKKLEASRIASETAYLNYKRQQELLDKGLSSEKDFEKAKIDYKKYVSEEANAATSLAKIEVQLSRQLFQTIQAPRDGTILRIMNGSGNVLVSSGEKLAVFVPKNAENIVELFIDGNDIPLINLGRKVRLQFEGWPVVQFSGWPSVSIGTFGGIIKSIDDTSNANGDFRVFIVPDPKDVNPWPSQRYLRQGVRVYGWVLLDEVKLGYELWRQLNGFPPSLVSNEKNDFFDDTSKPKKSKEKKEDE